MIQCEYYSIGCKVRMARKDQEKHKKENTGEHLMKTNLALTNTKQDLTVTKQDLTVTKQTLAYTTNQLANALQRISKLEESMHLTMDIITKNNSDRIITRMACKIGCHGNDIYIRRSSVSSDIEGVKL